MLPVPAYAFSWPKDALPRASWPESLTALAELLLKEVRSVRAKGPYYFAGHSFGATVCLEMARLVEAAGERVSLTALLDPRSLPPGSAELSSVFRATELADTVALLSQSAAEGSRYADQLEELAKVDAAQQAEALRQSLGAAALATLEHVHETSQWYAGLLAAVGQDASGDEERKPLQCTQLTWVSASQTWLQEPSPAENRAEATVRTFQAKVFQGDADVAKRLSAWCGREAPAAVRVPGGHFAMLHEPHVVATALRLCHSLAEAGAAELDA